MRPRPDERYRDVKQLAADVAAFRAGQPVSVHQETLIEQAVRLGRTYRAGILLVLAYLVMRVAVAVLAGW